MDDITLQAVGTRRLVFEQLSGAFMQLTAGLADRGLPISIPKTGYLASSAALSAALEPLWSLEEDGRRGTTRNVGTDAVDGGRRRNPISAKRHEDALVRARRLEILRKGGAEAGAGCESACFLVTFIQNNYFYSAPSFVLRPPT